MATIGLDKLYYSKITEDTNGNETYATPVSLAKAMTAELSVELAEATLYADDGAAEVVKEFQSGTLSLGVDDIGLAVAADIRGRRRSRSYRFPCEKGERQVPLFLALPRNLRHSRHEP